MFLPVPASTYRKLHSVVYPTGGGEGPKVAKHSIPKSQRACTVYTILESIRALAMNLPRNLNLEHTSSTTVKLAFGPRGQGNRPTGLWTYSGVLAAPTEEYINVENSILEQSVVG